MSRAEHDSLHTESANRKFYQLPSRKDVGGNVSEQKGDDEKLFRYIEDSVIGKDKTFSGPFGLRKALYCDYIASGRSLSFLEDYIRETVLPDYGNTHTTTTVTSLQTTLFRHESRDIIRNAVNASEHDAVIFTGSGCTGAIHKLIHALNLQTPPIVIVGPYEHHSTLLPWREVGSEVIRVRETPEGLVDIEQLKELLQACQGTSRQLIGCFAVASNITGILTDVDSVTATLHQYGALALWDYATGAPYLKIDMNPVSAGGQTGLCHKDAIFISAHKFVGGVQTPGILVVKKKLLQNPVPSGCGGGSVFFVRRDAHRYLQEAEMREEGGTPAIVESIRAGLVFQLKEAVGSEVIMRREHELCRLAFSRWKDVKDLVVLGNDSVDRLPIFSIMVRHQPSGLYLHYNFVCTLLNDLFGIQARGGCACAGPYAQDLLGINEELAKRIEDVLVEDSRLDRVHLRRYREYSEKEILRPGFARLSLPYFLNEDSVQFVLDAVEMVAQHGWKLLPQYNFNPETGEWRHRQHQVFKDRKWLGHVTYKTGHMTCIEPKFQEKGPLPQDYQDCLEQARTHFEQAHKTKVHIADQTVLFDSEVNDLRWFLLPSEAQLWLQNLQQAASSAARTRSPFHPAKYPRTDVRTQDLFSIREFKERIERAKVNETSCVDNSKTFEKSKDFQGTQNESTDSKVEARSNNPLKDTANSTFQEGLMSVILKGFNEDSLPESADASEITLRSTPTEEQPVEQPAVAMKTADSALKNPSTSASIHNLTEHSACKTNTSKSDDAFTQPVNNFSSQSPEEKPKLPEETAEEKPDTSPIIPNPKCTLKSPPKVPTVTTDRHRWHPPPKDIFRPTIQAIEEYDMISDGDCVLVCLSGGKDSLSLLHTLRQYQFYSKKKGITFELGAVTVDPQTSSYDPSPLKAYLAQLIVPYFYEEQCIMESAQSLPYECASICSFCSRMKRGRIYHCACREGYNVLALGQHLDDLAESFLMSMFHNGILRTMKACYTVQEGDLKVIRPFVYVREKDLRHFAEQKHLPVISENCPACFEAPKERHRMKQLLASQEVIHPRLFHSLLSAIKPVMSINKTGVNVKTLLCQQDGDGQNVEDGDIDEL